MSKYRKTLIEKVQKLRSLGKTYGEIRKEVGKPIPKSTLSYWCSSVPLPSGYSSKISKLNTEGLNKGRAIALEVNRVRRADYLKSLDEANLPFAETISDPKVAKVALSLLCLGEASKYRNGSAFYLGSSDSRIVIIFLELLKKCFEFDTSKVRCTVQCRTDQDIDELERYWVKVTGVSKDLFYKTRVDSRTSGKLTRKGDYKGVLRVDYFDAKVQLELESLADLVYKQLANPGP